MQGGAPLDGRIAQLESQLGEPGLSLLSGWDALRESYGGERFVYRVRDREFAVDLRSETLARTTRSCTPWNDLNIKGVSGAFVLGLAYGVLSGSCTFGFIAPILAIVTIQQESMTGVFLIVLFALGHCLPILVAGSSTAWVRKLTENSSWQGAGLWFRKGAGVVIALLGIYFILNPFIASV